MASEARRYTVSLKPSAVRDLAGLLPKDRKKIAGRIDSLAGYPRPRGAEKIEGGKDLYRVRVGDYRVVYQIEDNVLTVLVVAVGHRGDVYRFLKR